MARTPAWEDRVAPKAENPPVYLPGPPKFRTILYYSSHPLYGPAKSAGGLLE
jgi:hypothetical protein